MIFFLSLEFLSFNLTFSNARGILHSINYQLDCTLYSQMTQSVFITIGKSRTEVKVPPGTDSIGSENNIHYNFFLLEYCGILLLLLLYSIYSKLLPVAESSCALGLIRSLSLYLRKVPNTWSQNMEYCP